MRLDIYVHIEEGSEVRPLLDVIVKKLDLVMKQQEKTMGTLEDLKAAVTRNTDAGNSVVVLLQGISQQLKDAKASGDPAAIDEVIASLEAETTRFGEAVVANTPAA